MKKISLVLVTILLSTAVFLLGFNNKENLEPSTFYQIYLDDQILGVIKSKASLEKYIDEKGNSIKEKYNVDTVYPPNGLEIRKITTYNGKFDDIKAVYKKIEKLKPFTIEGYQFLIKNEDAAKNNVIYVNNKDIFEVAMKKAITTFVGKDNYELYLTDTQVGIKTIGSYIDNVYIDETITIKSVKISATETIYTDADLLSKYILFGTIAEQKKYIVAAGDTIKSVAERNKISIEEFLISNPDFTDSSNLLYSGQDVSIGVVNPIVSVVVETTTVEDLVSKYVVQSKKDDTLVLGDEEVIQNGVDGLDRVKSKIKAVNGTIVYANSVEKTELKPAVPEIVLVGTKYQSNVGGKYWTWPTESGWMITSGYTWRYHPLKGTREFHDALDIAGPGQGSQIFASNNGEVITAEWHYSYGYYIVINHNNGYYTLYSHLAFIANRIKEGTIVSRGQVIGYMGMTGSATGPHLHYELWSGGPPNGGGINLNPWTVHS